MSFLKKIKNSIYGLEFYEEVRKGKFKSSLKYFFKLTVLISLALTIFLSILFGPATYKFVSNLKAIVDDYYPENLILEVKGGEASTNVEGPLFLFAEENFLVIDTEHPFSVDRFERYGVFVWISKDSVAIIDENSNIQVVPLSDFPEVTISKDLALGFSEKIERPAKTFLLFLPLIVFIFLAIFYFSFYLLYMIFGAFVIWLIAKIKKAEMDFKESYKVGLHAATLGMIASLLSVISELSFGFAILFPFSFTIMLGVIAWVNIKKIETPPADDRA